MTSTSFIRLTYHVIEIVSLYSPESNGNNSNMNVIVQLEFELGHFEAAV